MKAILRFRNARPAKNRRSVPVSLPVKAQPKTPFGGTRVRAAAWLALVLVSSGCQITPHRKAQIEAEQQWKHVRARVKLQLAEQQYESQLFEDAARTTREALALNADQADAHVLLARALLELGRIASAEQTLHAARDRGLKSADLAYTEGVILEHRGRTEDALERYVFAADADPTDVDFLIARAECLVALNRSDEAIELLDERAPRVNHDASVHVLTARISALAGDHAGAMRRYRRALSAAPGDDAVIEALALLQWRAGQYQEVLGLLEPLVERQGALASGTVRKALAGCYLELQQPGAARRCLLEYASANSADVAAQLLLAQAAIALDDTPTALGALDRAAAADPSRAEVRFLRAFVDWRRGRTNVAIQRLHEWATAEPDAADAHCLLGEILASERQLEESRLSFERALRIDPENTWARAGLDRQ